MAMNSPKIGTRKAAAFRFSTSAHGRAASLITPLLCCYSRQEEEGRHGHVFEDQLRGMVSYRDENGEMIWEGYDEGVQVTDFI
ncbi:hypothetical protein BDA96_10G085600 [Sorghum bicolor]|uniref:Uncharacterized protein n=2 Tax=Sorghum bicolor TaxID=4558 RepID=A0A921U091_SORBI|nr:hypothetical protein BDA96_10G085600 [Sorghum bicolor]KXG19522.1 hypothetical protein SORBI_3010G071500 [Sorghum bicolor]